MQTYICTNLKYKGTCCILSPFKLPLLKACSHQGMSVTSQCCIQYFVQRLKIYAFSEFKIRIMFQVFRYLVVFVCVIFSSSWWWWWKNLFFLLIWHSTWVTCSIAVCIVFWSLSVISSFVICAESVIAGKMVLVDCEQTFHSWPQVKYVPVWLSPLGPWIYE
jgi:hypothetical protein